MKIDKSYRSPLCEVQKWPDVSVELQKVIPPDRTGRQVVKSSCGTPCNISWSIHGIGPTRIVIVAGIKCSWSYWAPLLYHFGHLHRDEYSCLVYDNRGAGKSDMPLQWYSSGGLASDCCELLQALGWSFPRNVHILGVSFGGMIALEVACRIPNQIASLSLISTSPCVGTWRNGIETLIARPSLLFPKSLEAAINHNADSHFETEWLSRRDQHILETIPGDGEYHTRIQQSFMYSSNYDKWVALQAAMMNESGGWSSNLVRDYLFPLAAMLHHTSSNSLYQIRERVGSGRIMVAHGDKDKMINMKHGKGLAQSLGVETCLAPGSGHGIIWDNTQWIVIKLENHIRENII